MKPTATLVTLQGDKLTINQLEPVHVGIWRLDILARSDQVNTIFLGWIQECSKKLHMNGEINVTILNSKNQML